MLVDEGDELLVGGTEYTVLNKVSTEGKEYIFVATKDNPDINIADNFDLDALKLLMLSQDNTFENCEDTNYTVKYETSSYFDVEKEPNKIEKILELMFMQ